MPRRALGLGLAMVVAAIVAGGCEAIVGSALPPYSCTGTNPSACPAGEYCSQGACVACEGAHCGAVDAATDATLLDVVADVSPADGHDAMDSPSPPLDGAEESVSEASEDAPADGGDAGCGIGCACTTASGCTTGICGTFEVLGMAFTAAHGTVCTATCCTSANCPAGYVCFGPGNAGGYCVLSTDLGAPATLGVAGPGATCHQNTDCRSGSCAAGHCVDMCCLDSDCATGTSCALDTSGVNGHESFVCSVPTGAGALHASCTNASQCADNVCEFDTCRGHCCGAASCSASGFTVCSLDTAGSDSVYYCDYASLPSGSSFGQSCVHATDCTSHQCNAASATCTDACCQDSDCTTYGNYVCRPATVAPYNLICMAP